MKSNRVEKLTLQMYSIEDELRTLLQTVLPSAVESGADFFTNSSFNPHKLFSAHMQPKAEKMLCLAEESLSLRSQLELARQGSVGDLYLTACSEAADLNNMNRRGPRKLAAWLLHELVNE